MSDRDTETREQAREHFEEWYRERKHEAIKRESLASRIESYLVSIEGCGPCESTDGFTAAIVRDIRRILSEDGK